MIKKLAPICLFVTVVYSAFLHNGIPVEAASKYQKMVVANVENSLNVREKASTNSTVVGKMKRGSVGTIVQKGAQWTKIKSGTVVGYVSNDYVLSGTKMENFAKANIKVKEATVTTDVLNVREKKSTKAKVLGKVTKGESLNVAEQAKNWTKISYKKKAGYVFNQYIDIEYQFSTATPIKSNDSNTSASNNTTGTIGNSNVSDSIQTEVPTKEPEDQNTNTTEPEEEQMDADELREELVQYALQFVGNPYVYGGTSLTEGADCSGFVQSIYRNFGISLNRVSADQALNGRKVSLDEIKPGDLIFYVSKGSTKISHVSLYIGDGQVVHALNQEKGVCVSSMYYNTPYVVRNVID